MNIRPVQELAPISPRHHCQVYSGNYHHGERMKWKH